MFKTNKKNKEKYSEYLKDEPLQEEEAEEDEDDKYYTEDEEAEEDSRTNNNIESYNETPINSLQYAAQLSKPSPTTKAVKQLPFESRYAFYEENEVKDVRRWSENHHRYNFIQKILELQYNEDINFMNNRMALYDIKTPEQLKEYFKQNNISIVYNQLEAKGEVFKLLEHIKQLKQNGYYEDIMNHEKQISDIFSDYKDTHNVLPQLDDLYMTGNIVSTTITSMGRRGQERQASITSIQETRNVDVQKQVEEKTDYKNKLMGVVRRMS